MLSLLLSLSSTGQTLPAFTVPGFETEMALLNDLHARHHGPAFTRCTLWDGWLPQATLWASAKKREQYRAALLEKRIDAEGYVSMQQHRGMAHSEGWPFPAWQQSGGKGFHFSLAGDGWGIQSFSMKPLTDTSGWEFTGARVQNIDTVAGLRLTATANVVRITTPPFRCATTVAPFVRIEWAMRGLPPESQPIVEWMLEGETDWPPGRHLAFPPLAGEDGMRFANVPLYRHDAYAGIVTRYRFTFNQASGAEIDLKSVITAVDTRHPTTNSLFLRGCADYFSWTADVSFLRENIWRMRRALHFALEEFSVREGKHVRVPWVGHEGRSGLASGPKGEKSIQAGRGVGNNYWDLLPFGGHDAIATIYLYDALRYVSRLERSIAAHPEWGLPAASAPFGPADLDRLADDIRTDFQERFWNAATGRFHGWVDLDGRAHDYGFTFVNLEAIHYGLVAPRQAESIFAWIDGARTIPSDTSHGADIYRWRFAPRATTRRNVETYVWVWRSPESIPWGNQVQDGGAVLGFSYHDIMARLQINGPDDAWKRLRQILDWYWEVQAEGGYRAYYSKPGRGTLQGGGRPGGLGMDVEFLESVLVPQVMLQGFLGFTPGPDGYTIKPKLPADWPELTVSGIRFHDQILDITVRENGTITTCEQ